MTNRNTILIVLWQTGTQYSLYCGKQEHNTHCIGANRNTILIVLWQTGTQYSLYCDKQEHNTHCIGANRNAILIVLGQTGTQYSLYWTQTLMQYSLYWGKQEFRQTGTEYSFCLGKQERNTHCIEANRNAILIVLRQTGTQLQKLLTLHRADQSNSCWLFIEWTSQLVHSETLYSLCWSKQKYYPPCVGGNMNAILFVLGQIYKCNYWFCNKIPVLYFFILKNTICIAGRFFFDVFVKMIWSYNVLLFVSNER